MEQHQFLHGCPHHRHQYPLNHVNRFKGLLPPDPTSSASRAVAPKLPTTAPGIASPPPLAPPSPGALFLYEGSRPFGRRLPCPAQHPGCSRHPTVPKVQTCSKYVHVLQRRGMKHVDARPFRLGPGRRASPSPSRERQLPPWVQDPTYPPGYRVLASSHPKW